MKTAIDVLALFLVLIVAVWALGFGSVGSVVARRRGLRRAHGFMVGAVFGPVGLTWLLWRGRQRRSRRLPQWPDPPRSDRSGPMPL